MPGGDRTGPRGAGPRTGRAAGFCAGSGMPGYANPTFGRSMGLDFRGGGRGWRHVYHATGLPYWARSGYDVSEPVAGADVQALRAQADALRAQLEAISKRIDEIEG